MKNEKAKYHEELIEYLLNPYDNRTYESFCESLGMSVSAIYRYRCQHKEEIDTEVKARREEVYGAMRMEADKALLKNLKKGSESSLKLFYQLCGDLVEKSEVSTNTNLTIEEKRKKVASLFEGLGMRHILPEMASGLAQVDSKASEGAIILPEANKSS